MKCDFGERLIQEACSFKLIVQSAFEVGARNVRQRASHLPTSRPMAAIRVRCSSVKPCCCSVAPYPVRLSAEIIDSARAGGRRVADSDA